MSSTEPKVPSFSLISTGLLASSTVFIVLATAAVVLRFYARKVKSLALKWDDWTIVISLVMTWFYTIDTWVTAGIGGVNMTTLSPEKAVVLFERCLWIEGIPLGISLATIKISILLFYRRIFVTKKFQLCVDLFVVVLIGWGLSTVIALFLVSDPIAAAFRGGKLRYNFGAWSLAVAGMSIIFDLMVLCFPLPMIRNLKMPTRRKIHIAGVFWLGGFCCISAALRFYFLYEGSKHVLSSAGHNQYHYATREFTWAHIEPNASIVAACLPTYGTLFAGDESPRKWFSSMWSFMSLGSRSGASGKAGSGGGSESGLALDSKRNGNWQKLVGRDDLNNSGNYNVVSIAGGSKFMDEDLEAQQEGTAPLKIAVKKEFGSEF